MGFTLYLQIPCGHLEIRLVHECAHGEPSADLPKNCWSCGAEVAQTSMYFNGDQAAIQRDINRLPPDDQIALKKRIAWHVGRELMHGDEKGRPPVPQALPQETLTGDRATDRLAAVRREDGIMSEADIKPNEADIKAAEAVWANAVRVNERSTSPTEEEIAAEQKASDATADLKGEVDLCISLGCRNTTEGMTSSYCAECAG